MIPGFLKRGLLEVILPDNEERFIAFETPRPRSEPVQRIESPNNESSIISNEFALISWEVTVSPENTPPEFISRIVIDDVVVEISGENTWQFLRDTQSKKLILEKDIEQLDELASLLTSACTKVKEAGLKYQNEPLSGVRVKQLLQPTLSIENNPKAGIAIIHFHALGHAEGIGTTICKRLKSDGEKVENWINNTATKLLSNIDPSPSLGTFSIRDPKSLSEYGMTVNQLSVRLTQIIDQLSKHKKDQTYKKALDTAENHSRGIDRAIKLLPDLQSVAGQLQALNKQLKDAKIIQLTASRTFPVPDPDGKEPIPVHIKILELKPAKPKPKEGQKKKKK
jgi:hypothetical protein